MIRTSPATIHRAAAVVLAAVAFSFTTHRASAQQTVDLFGGPIGSSALLTATTNLVTAGASQTGTFGPGYNGTVNLGLGAIDSVTESFATLGASNSFSITQTGVAAAGSNTSATKTLGLSLTPNAVYNLTLTRTTGFTVGLLSSLNIQLTEGGTSVLGSTTGQGLLGVVDALSLFGTNNTATFQFAVPSTASGPLLVNISSALGAGVLNGGYTFTSATINQVPEPHTVAALLMGAGGLAVLRIRRRLRAV